MLALHRIKEVEKHVGDSRDVEVHDLLEQRTKLRALEGMRSEGSGSQVVLDSDEGGRSAVKGSNQIRVEGPELGAEVDNILSSQT